MPLRILTAVLTLLVAVPVFLVVAIALGPIAAAAALTLGSGLLVFGLWTGLVALSRAVTRWTSRF